jgi:hypothetical protein
MKDINYIPVDGAYGTFGTESEKRRRGKLS